ncbi:MAG: hypothetical protein K1X89_05830 [Myxococcaceae bacterium]|nr:hypothetical protein [Myxococcaceae bacterium]
MKLWALLAAASLNLYLLGVMVLFAAVVYPQFASVDRAVFPPLYQAFTARIPVPVVLFEFLAFFSTLVLYAARPDAVPAWLVHAVVALGVAYFAITFGWHLKTHAVLGQGDNSAEVLRRLLASQWARTAVHAARVGLLAWALALR